MNPFDRLISSLTGKAAQSVGMTVAADPQVQAAIEAAKVEYAQLQTLKWIVGIAGGLTLAFYYLPRFESPIPRIWRKRR